MIPRQIIYPVKIHVRVHQAFQLVVTGSGLVQGADGLFHQEGKDFFGEADSGLLGFVPFAVGHRVEPDVAVGGALVLDLIVRGDEGEVER